MAKASARDFDGAVADLGRAAAELSDEDARKMARADAEELKRAAAMLPDAQEALSQLPRGQTVSLTCRGEKGERKQISGMVQRAARDASSSEAATPSCSWRRRTSSSNPWSA
jgi:hypothetical protein